MLTEKLDKGASEKVGVHKLISTHVGNFHLEDSIIARLFQLSFLASVCCSLSNMDA